MVKNYFPVINCSLTYFLRYYGSTSINHIYDLDTNEDYIVVISELAYGIVNKLTEPINKPMSNFYFYHLYEHCFFNFAYNDDDIDDKIGELSIISLHNFNSKVEEKHYIAFTDRNCLPDVEIVKNIIFNETANTLFLMNNRHLLAQKYIEFKDKLEALRLLNKLA